VHRAEEAHEEAESEVERLRLELAVVQEQLAAQHSYKRQRTLEVPAGGSQSAGPGLAVAAPATAEPDSGVPPHPSGTNPPNSKHYATYNRATY